MSSRRSSSKSPRGSRSPRGSMRSSDFHTPDEEVEKTNGTINSLVTTIQKIQYKSENYIKH